MKYKTMFNLIAVIFVFAAMTACDTDSQADSGNHAVSKISAEELKDMMDQESALIIVDVRTPEEFAEGYIPGAVNIPDTEIEATAEDVLLDKEAMIVVYCRSGRRSAISAKTLSEIGYTNVYDLGGILDWPYDIVTD